MTSRARALLFTATLLLLLVWQEAGAGADNQVVDISPAFPLGPYTAMHIDRNNPDRIAIGTADGRIAWSENGGYTVRQSRVLSHRRYDAMAIRGHGTSSHLGGGQEGEGGTAEDEDASQNQASGRGRHALRPVRLFIDSLQTGKGVVRWQYWRAVTDPLTEISSVVLPVPGGRFTVATPMGIFISDDKGGAWNKTLGAPGTMPKEEKDLVGLSVITNPVNPKVVLAGTTKGVYVSTDGGITFVPHTDTRLAEEMIFEFLWDPADPDVVLAVGPDSILQSLDGGKNFEIAFVANGEINSVVATDFGVLVADTSGLTLVGGQGNTPLVSGENCIGAAAWDDGRLMVATSEKLFMLDGMGNRETLMTTPENDPFMKFDGAPGRAYLMSSTGLYRMGAEPARKKAKLIPVMGMSLWTVQRTMMKHLGIGSPEDTRLHARWYAHLLPRVTVDAGYGLGRDDWLNIDFTLPLDFRYATARTDREIDWSVTAVWDLSDFVFGDTNVSNPDLFIESTLLANRDMMLHEVRTRYRDAEMLAHRLKNPPKDPKLEFLWRMRLEEHASYLEYVTGKPVVTNVVPEETK